MTKTMEKPAGLVTLETSLKAEIAMWTGKGYGQDSLAVAKQKLTKVRRLWQKFKDDPTIQKMAAVVSQKLTAYHMDFYEIDLEAIEGWGATTPFVWVVRASGTHIYPLTGKPLEIEGARSGLNVFSKNNDDILEPNHEFYLVNIAAGTMRKVTKRSSVPFKVTEPLGIETRQDGTWTNIFKGGMKIGVVQAHGDKFYLYSPDQLHVFTPQRREVASVEAAIKWFAE